MPTARFIQDGNLIDHTPSSNVAAGDVIVQNDLIGIAPRDIPANTLGSLAVTGVFDLPKATGTSTAIATGKKVYWDATDKQAKEDSESGANKYLGKTAKPAADADATVRTRLEQ